MTLLLQTFVLMKWPSVRRWSLLAIVFMGLSAVPIYGQNIPVSGVVKSTLDNEPLIGVNVVIKGTTTGAVTDVNGTYKLLVNSEDDVLVFSSIGSITEEIKVGNKSIINVDMMPDITALDEVVVVGYGTAKREDVTGAISSISGDELRKTQPVTFDQALQGKVAGVVVQQTSGQPGGGVSVQIRGMSSFGNNSPLYVIDGVIIGQGFDSGGGTNPLATISPSDIESIDVLKD